MNRIGVNKVIESLLHSFKEFEKKMMILSISEGSRVHFNPQNPAFEPILRGFSTEGVNISHFK